MLFLIQEFILPLILLVVVKSSGDCVIYDNPTTRIILLNQTALLQCAVDTGPGNIAYLLFNDGQTSISADKTQYEERGIVWISDVVDGKTLFNISVLGTTQNNGFSVMCGLPPVCFTSEAEVIVVEAPPSPPNPPVVMTSNITSLNISWSSSWPYPVNSYNVLIQNGIYSNEIDTIIPNIVFNKNGSFSECTLFSFSVQVNTEVGYSEFSQATLAGFPTDLSTIQTGELNLSIIKEKCAGQSSSKLNISILDSLNVCAYDTLLYEFEVIDEHTDKPVEVITPDDKLPQGYFYTSTDNVNSLFYKISLTVKNQAGQLLTISNRTNISNIRTVIVYASKG